MTKEMAGVTLAAAHSSIQFVAGSAIGGLLDTLFPRIEERLGTQEDLLMNFVEVIAQISLGGVVTAGVIAFLDQTLAIENQDPTNGIGYTLGVIYSQPNLIAKIQSLSAAIRPSLTVTGPGQQMALKSKPLQYMNF